MNRTEKLRRLAEKESLFGPGKKHLKRVISPQLLRDITASEEQTADPQILCFIQWCLLTLARGSEAITARWSHIDFDRKIWTIPGGNQIPLSPQAVAVLLRLQALDLNALFLFPARNNPGETMCQERATMELRKLSEGKLSIHDFRAVACAMMKVAKFEEELIKSVFFPDPCFPPEIRTEIMAWWGRQTGIDDKPQHRPCYSLTEMLSVENKTAAEIPGKLAT
ncbi:tyrosine-type recombinase/integrase [Salmonella enterica]